MPKVLADLLVSLVTLSALACIVYGVRLIYPPAAWIVCGLVLLLIALGSNRRVRLP